MRQDGVGDHRRRCEASVAGDSDLDAVGRQYFESAAMSRLGQCVRVAPEIEGPIDALLAAVVADGLADGQNMSLVEGMIQRGAAVARGTEDDLMGRLLRIGLQRIVGADQARYVDQKRRGCRLAGEFVERHFGLRVY
jgi:hypothetical protein